MNPQQLAALSPDGYPIPTAVISRRRLTLLMTASLAALFAWLAYRAAQDTGALLGHDHEALLWSLLMLVASHQTLLAWFDKPYTVTAEQQGELDRIPVHVSVPLFNESPEIVDRVMYALAVQTRLPQRIVVVDDGTTDYDYSPLRAFWAARFAEIGVVCEWVRQANAGKRHAQAVAFRSAEAGIMVTLDSDTALERTALAEVVKPFADPRVWSVAGLELAYNQTANLLTRINGMRQLSWQMVQCAALNRFGAILVNRGTFAAYRVELVRENLEAYLAEKFMGKPVRYSDDSLLTLYALGRGKAVQQVSAHQYSEYAEKLSHALRQWTRWMRGATIRSIWRAKYLPLTSYAGLVNMFNWWQLAASSAAYGYVGVVLPLEHRASLSALSAAVGASYLANVRTLLIERDDQDGLSQLDTWLLSPLAWAWSLLVLRPTRLYAILTCGVNDWGTRKKIEVGELAGLTPAPLPVAAVVGAEHPTAEIPAVTGWAGRGDADTEPVPVVPAGPPPGHGPDEEPTTLLEPYRAGRVRRRRWGRGPVTVLAVSVSALAVAAVAAGLVLSVHRNVIPPAHAAVVHGPTSTASVGTIVVPTDGASLTRPAASASSPVLSPVGLSASAPAGTRPPAASSAAPAGQRPTAGAGPSSPAASGSASPSSSPAAPGSSSPAAAGSSSAAPSDSASASGSSTS